MIERNIDQQLMSFYFYKFNEKFFETQKLQSFFVSKYIMSQSVNIFWRRKWRFIHEI